MVLPDIANRDHSEPVLSSEPDECDDAWHEDFASTIIAKHPILLNLIIISERPLPADG